MSPEDTNATTLLDPLCSDDAYQRVVAFARHFGEPHTILAMHAALPLGLTPEIVHLIRINFASTAPLIAEADLLLSPLCREVGRDLYEMLPDVRDLLLEELKSDPEFGPSRVVMIAEFLLAYAERAIKLTKSPEILDFLRAQEWVALAYARPKDAAQSLALALREGLESANRDETVRIASLTKVLATPLIAEEKVLLYAAGVEKLAAGDRSGASRLLEAVGPTDQSPSVGNVSLPSPSELMQVLGRSLSTPEAPTPLVLYPNLNCPSQIIINQKFSLFVQLLSEPPREGIEAIHIKDTGVHEELPEVEVVLCVSSFDVEGSNTKVLRVQRDDISQEEFVLIPHHLDEQQIQVEFYQHSRLIGTARHSVSIVAKTTQQELRYDVFLAHNSADKPEVRAIADQLITHGITVLWLDEEQIPPGRSFQDEIQKAIPLVKSAAIFVGLKGFGKWQTKEVRLLTKRCVEKGIRLIPVLLPGLTQLPKNLVFLTEYRWVVFSKSIHDVQALNNLVWGITRSKSLPQQKLIGQLNGKQFQQLHKALLSAFPTKAKLEQMVRFQLAHNLNYFTTGEDYSHVVFRLIEWAEAQGQLEELLTAALKENPRNLALQKFGEQLLGTFIDEEQSEQGDDLSSEKGVDYTRLRDLLKAGNWKKADEETFALMLKIGAREREGWLDLESIEQFPSNDLRTIDQLWVESSRGRFGFSVQKHIWAIHGGETEADYEIYERFSEHVGWYKRSGWDKEWRKWAELSFSINAPSGHLPAMYGKRLKRGQVVELTGNRKWLFFSLLSRPDL